MGSTVTEGEDGSFHGPFVHSDESDRFRAAAVPTEQGGEEHLKRNTRLRSLVQELLERT